MEETGRNKLLARIKKCLALSKSPEPHEAAAAMRQAQKMMDALGVTEDDIDGLSVQNTLIKTREGFGRCVFVTRLGALIAETFGVQRVHERNPGAANRLNVRYIGPVGRVQLAEYTHKVVQRAVDTAWEVHLGQYPYHKGDGGKREAFRLGWLAAIQEQVQAMEITDKEERAILRHKDSLYGTSLVAGKGRKVSLDKGMYSKGQDAAEGFALHQPMTQEQLKIGHDK